MRLLTVAAVLFGPLLGMAGTAAAATAAPVPQQSAASFSDGRCASGDTSSVTVVIDFQDLGGGIVIRCGHGLQAGANGIAAMRAAGIAFDGNARFGSAFVCRILGRPSASEELPIDGGGYREKCIDTSPAKAYWSYWQASENGDWVYSSLGIASQKARLGGFEGWSFSLNRTSATNPKPGVATTLDAPAAPEPTAAPPTTRPAPATTARPTTARPTPAPVPTAERPTPAPQPRPTTAGPAVTGTPAPAPTAPAAPPTPGATAPVTTAAGSDPAGPRTSTPAATTTASGPAGGVSTGTRSPQVPPSSGNSSTARGSTGATTPRPTSRAGVPENPSGTTGSGDRTTTGPTTGSNAAGTDPSGSGESGAGRSGSGQNGAGQNSAGQNSAGQNSAGQNSVGQNSVGQNSAGQNSAGQNGVDPDNASTPIAPDSSSPWPVIAVLSLALIAGGAAFVIARRRRGDGV